MWESKSLNQTTITSHNAQIYKTPGTKNSQAQRRHQLLQAIKTRRHSSIDEKRNINDVFEEMPCKQEHLNQEEHEEPMDTSLMLHSVKHKKLKKLYANKLMLSEWLLEKPADLEEKWLMKVCPKGVRNLVVAHKGKTKCFTKSGHFIRQIQSQLPGGSTTTPMKFTLLDCVYQQTENTFYVLDVLVWNSYSVLNSSTEFRFFFIESKLNETDVRSIHKGNESKFLCTPHKPANLSTIAHEFSEFEDGIDGVLFYHVDVCYLSQVTPLVGWLKVYMLPEVLNIPVSTDFLFEKPEQYENIADYIHNIEKLERRRHRKQNKRMCDTEMEDISILEGAVME